MTIVVSVTLEKTQQQQETHKLISDGLGYIHLHNIYTLINEKQQHETATSQGWGYNNRHNIKQVGVEGYKRITNIHTLYCI